MADYIPSAGSRRYRTKDTVWQTSGWVTFGAIVALLVAIKVALDYRYWAFVVPLQAENAASVSLAFIRRTVDFNTIIAAPTGTENAAEYYHRGTKPFDYRRARREGYEPKNFDDLDANASELNYFLKGARQRLSRFAPDIYPAVTKPGDLMPTFPVYRAAADAFSDRVDLLLQKSYTVLDSDEKQEYIDSARRSAATLIIMGRHLADERLSAKQVLIGERMSNLGAKKLRKIEFRLDNTENIKTINRYIFDGERMIAEMEEKLGYMTPLDEAYVDALIRIAREDEDPMFRRMAAKILRANLDGFMRRSLNVRMRAAVEEYERRDEAG